MLFALALCLFFQDVQEQVAVDYVIVDVAVTDKKGVPIADIKPTEFVVKDGRRVVELSHFEVLDLRQGAVRSVIEAELDPIEQTMILTLDFALSNMEQARETLKELGLFLDGRRHHQPVQMFLYSMDLGPISRGFSTNPDSLIDDLVAFEGALERYIEERGNNIGFSLTNLEKEMRTCFPGGVGSNTHTTNAANSAQIVMPCLENLQKNYSQRHIALAKNRIQVLEKFMVFWQRISGPKHLYMVSSGLPASPGAEAADMARGFANYRNAMRSGVFGSTNAAIYTEDSQPFSAPHFQLNASDGVNNRLELKDEFESLADLALATRCTIHTFYLAPDETGLRESLNLTKEQSEEARINQARFTYETNLGEGLRALSDLTGGVARRVNDLSEALDATLFDARHYYVLAWPKPKKKGRKFRNISIEVDRPGLKLVHRKGYLPKRKEKKKR